MSEDAKELALRGQAGEMVPLSELDSVLEGTEGRSTNLLDTLAVYRQGKDDYFKFGDDKVDSVTGIFLLSRRPTRAMWESEELTGDPPDCFSLDGIVPHEVVDEPPADKCADCPFDKLGSGKGRSKKCKTKANDFVLLVRSDVPVSSETEVAEVTPRDLIGPGLLNYSTANRGASRAWQNWLRSVRESGNRPQGVIARWGFSGDRTKQGVDYSFVRIETVAPLPSPEEAPQLWSAIVSSVQQLKAGQSDEVLFALSGGAGDDDDE